MKRGLVLFLAFAFMFSFVSSAERRMEYQDQIFNEQGGPPHLIFQSSWLAQTFTIGTRSPNYDQKINYVSLEGLIGSSAAKAFIREVGLISDYYRPLGSSGNIPGCSGDITLISGATYKYRANFPNCILEKGKRYALIISPSSTTDRWSLALNETYPGSYPIENGLSFTSPNNGENWVFVGCASHNCYNFIDFYFELYGDYIPPGVTLTNPTPGQFFTNNNIPVIGNSDKIVYLWETRYTGSYSGSNYYFQSGTSFNRQLTLYNGEYTLMLSAWEFEEGSAGSDSVSFSVAQRPTITISSPSNNQVFSSTNNVTVTATSLPVNTPQNRITQWRIEIDGATQPAINYSYTGTTLNLNRGLTNLPMDTYTLRVYGRDDSGIWGVSASRSFSVTYNPPRLEIIHPENGGYYEAPFMITPILDTTLTMNNYNYVLVGPTGTTTGSFICQSSGGGGSCTSSATIGAMSEGIYTLTISAGGLSDSVTFTVGPAPCTPSRTCAYYGNLGQCGSGLSDGCENILNCGCPTGQNCVSGTCVAILNPIYRWENSAGNEISSAQVGNTVFLVIQNSGLAPDSSATFGIYDNDALLDDHIRDVVGITDSDGTLRANWTISQSDYDDASSSDDHEEYYFRANSVSSSIISGYLAIEESSGEPELEIVFPKCGENFTLGDNINIEINAFNFDSGTLTVYKVGEDNVELQLETYNLVYGNNNFNYIFNSGLGGGNYRLVAELINSLGERIRRTSNIMIVDLSSIEGTFYAAACIDEPEDLSNLPSGIVRFNASSSRGILFIPSAGSFPYQIIPLVNEDLLFKWRFSDEGSYRDNPYTDGGIDERAYLFYKIFIPVNNNRAELEVEVKPLGAVQ